MKMQKRQFRIGELAKTLGVERFVIRFWEKEFRVRSQRSEGGQRFYSERDLLRFQIIKRLLYEQGFTIAGAKKQLHRLPGDNETLIIGSHKTFLESDELPAQHTPEAVRQQLRIIREKMCLLKQMLSRRND